MKDELKLLGETILREKQEIAKSVHQERMAGVSMSEQEKKAFKTIEQKIIDIRTQFIELLGEGYVTIQILKPHLKK
ncbi:hypothetical protein NLX67_17565 [Domibacillus sp. A3M-37]|uniref:hypothetical protein n=1 Tax=Domibacillus TaxID=1433999 RepID=UPI0020B82F83|nr:hypothetical protein [Domibacillus sp. A3M-37]MCP3764160.1 hypothetical protein [Domibacillus sp. A3M-37]